MKSWTNPPSVLITGASGFLGSRLTEALCASGAFRVTATGRRRDRQAEFEAMGACFVAADLTDEAAAQKLCKGQDLVVHCAALSSPWGKYETFFQANVLSTRHLLQAARARGVRRVINIGTPSIYVNFQDRNLVSELDPLPRHMPNAYAATKLIAEKEILAANDAILETLSLRPRAIIGRGDTVIFPRVLRGYEEGRLRVVGSGENLADVTSVSNLVDAIQLAMHADSDALGAAYNITNGEPLPLWDLFRYLFEQMNLPFAPKKISLPVMNAIATSLEWHARIFGGGKEPVITRYGVSTLAHTMTLDIRLARERLGYQPKQSSWEGIDEFLSSLEVSPT